MIKWKELPRLELSRVCESLIDLKIIHSILRLRRRFKQMSRFTVINGIIRNINYQQSTNKTISSLRGHGTDENSFWMRAKRRTTACTAFRRSHPRDSHEHNTWCIRPFRIKRTFHRQSYSNFFVTNKRWKRTRMGVMIQSHNHNHNWIISSGDM